MPAPRPFAGLLGALLLLAAPARAEPVLAGALAIPGGATDLFPADAPGANSNRLGGFFSDLHFDRPTGAYYGLADRGPGGGTLSYDTRVQRFTLDVDPATGAIGGFVLARTIVFTDADGRALNALDPARLNGDPGVLGRSFDPEGFAVGRGGTFYVSDEYGPAVLEFDRDGRLLRRFATPANLVPRERGGAVNLVAGPPTLAAGRQDNRGFEGLAITPDGSRLYAILQGPLVEEGDPNGRYARHLRIVEYSTSTGQPGRQFLYALDPVASINGAIPAPEHRFRADAQGRAIGVSSLTALNAEEFLVIERDTRGVGVEDPLGVAPVGSKRVYRIGLAGATDVSGLSLAGTNEPPPGVVPVSKTLFLDVAVALAVAGLAVPEKLEGLTIGPRLADGGYAVLIGSDNDFAVTQGRAGGQADVCAGGGAASQVALGAACPAGQALLPTYLYSFKASIPGYQPQARDP